MTGAEDESSVKLNMLCCEYDSEAMVAVSILAVMVCVVNDSWRLKINYDGDGGEFLRDGPSSTDMLCTNTTFSYSC